MSDLSDREREILDALEKDWRASRGSSRSKRLTFWLLLSLLGLLGLIVAVTLPGWVSVTAGGGAFVLLLLGCYKMLEFKSKF